MNQASRLAVGSFSFLMTLVGVCGAAEQQFSCKGQVIEFNGRTRSLQSMSASALILTAKCHLK